MVINVCNDKNIKIYKMFSYSYILILNFFYSRSLTSQTLLNIIYMICMIYIYINVNMIILVIYALIYCFNLLRTHDNFLLSSKEYNN